jgi:hypothetical protein
MVALARRVLRFRLGGDGGGLLAEVIHEACACLRVICHHPDMGRFLPPMCWAVCCSLMRGTLPHFAYCYSHVPASLITLLVWW